ncbi:MAG: hypothetical protein BJ554DRAFT_1330 [Olpidium bornovanus]|uniref:Uncharacterized protein n=1 Tax=Olpidium bornovanus TaxID=278681 RepID=A0A8H7ZS85_9FUNG|nr:MAG: hypothetical protein BJ554DRAFT_1330 [Olpidium bornovanus]
MRYATWTEHAADGQRLSPAPPTPPSAAASSAGSPREGNGREGGGPSDDDGGEQEVHPPPEGACPAAPMSNATWPCVMNRKDDAVAASDHSSHRTANGATLQPTPPELDPEALANLDAVCQAVLMWGPKAKWKIDLLLLPDALQDAGIADPTPSAFPGMLSAPAPPLLAGPGKSSGADGAHDAPYAHALFGGNEIRHQVHRFDRLVTSEPHKMVSR